MLKFKKKFAILLVASSFCFAFLGSCGTGIEDVEGIDELISSVDPTEEKDGSKTYKNSVTNEEHTEVIPKLDNENYVCTFIEPKINDQGTYDDGLKTYFSEKYGTFTVVFTIYQTYQDSFGEGRKYETNIKDGKFVSTIKESYQLNEDETLIIKTKNILEEVLTSASTDIFSFQTGNYFWIAAHDANDIGTRNVGVGYLLNDYTIVASKPSDESTIISSTANFEIGKEYTFNGVENSEDLDLGKKQTITNTLKFTFKENDKVDLWYLSKTEGISKGYYDFNTGSNAFYHYKVQEGIVYFYEQSEFENETLYSIIKELNLNFKDLIFESSSYDTEKFLKETIDQTFIQDGIYSGSLKVNEDKTLLMNYYGKDINISLNNCYISEKFTYDKETDLIVEEGKYEIIVNKGSLYTRFILNIKDKTITIIDFMTESVLEDRVQFSLGSTIGDLDNGDTITLNDDGTGYVHCVKENKDIEVSSYSNNLSITNGVLTVYDFTINFSSDNSYHAYISDTEYKEITKIRCNYDCEKKTISNVTYVEKE
jgi:hypothetical protein